MSKFYRISFFSTVLLTATFTYLGLFESKVSESISTEKSSQQLWEEQLQQKAERRKHGYAKFDGPDKFQEFHAGIRTREGEVAPDYPANYRYRELAKVKAHSERIRRANLRTYSDGNGVLSFTERGPSNTPGRTRTLLVMPQDATHSTWLAGSSGGGIWKTTNKGQSWTNKSPDFPTLAVATLAMPISNPLIIYAGTGEYIASSGTAINGDGIFKSTDGGDTWTHLTSTAGNPDFVSITRIIVDPNNPDLVLACSAPNTWATGPNRFRTTIMRSTDGGTTWARVFEAASGGAMEQLLADPTNFSIQYAARNGVGVYKSTDAGASWQLSNTGMNPSGRVEIAIAPSNTNRLYASTVGNLNGVGADLYTSSNAGLSWDLVEVKYNDNSFDFLGGQGWYDNTIACDPFNENRIYFGGVDVFRLDVTGTSGQQQTQYQVLENNTTSFMTLVNFGANAYGGRVSVGPSAGSAKVELRYGNGLKQFAHRFTVPEGATSGVSDANYSYQDYVEVPFQAWDVTNNQQLNIAFRDQNRNGVFDLITQNTEGEATTQSREYLYISNTTYSSANPTPNMAVQGGHVTENKYFIWPVLSSGATWNPESLPSSTFEVTPVTLSLVNATTLPVADMYGRFNNRNRFITISKDVHPDQHYLVMVPTNVPNKQFFVILTTDGGVFYSDPGTSPGVEQGTWNFAGNGYNTGQFYGADKRPGRNEYFGGMQDNGTWQSPAGASASAATQYNFRIGGDGFEVLWNNDDDQKLIGGSQNNNFRRSTNGGQTWQVATSGLSGTQPFVSKLANSKYNPNVIFTVSSAGVFKSSNFGESWGLRSITENWGASTFLNVKVSDANPNIVWAGSGMVNTGNRRNLYVSTDGGDTFSMTNNYTEVPLGSITRLATHPTLPNTAFALFSFARGPKVLRTDDLGETWHDLSGFNGNETSAKGFPDVAVYCLYVRPDNPDIIWVGSEIGIIQSLDNGNSWELMENFPSASVWDMKGIDNQVVIATHGRGIWTAEIDTDQFAIKLPEYLSFSTTPTGGLLVNYQIKQNFDSVTLFINGAQLRKAYQVEEGVLEFDVVNGQAPGNKNLKVVGYLNGGPFHSKTTAISFRGVSQPTNAYFTDFTTGTAFTAFNGTGLASTFLSPFSGRLMQTAHPYPTNRELFTNLEVPIIVSDSYPYVHYQDIALFAEGDKVSIEATRDGREWIVLDEYSTSRSAQWTTLAGSNGNPTLLSQFEWQLIDLTETFESGEIILIRFVVSSTSGLNNWGWAMNELYIQVEPLSVETKQADKLLQMFPNPARQQTTLQLEELANQPVAITVTDAFGRQVYQSNMQLDAKGATTLPLHQMRQGTYLVTLQTLDKRRFVKKLSVLQ
jgi:photosystem II stability/assembly factor-like uncharacterized protein